MLRLLKFLIILGLIGAAGVVGYAYLGDLSPQTQTISEPVEFDAR